MTTQHETAIKAARDAYWSETHHGSGYDDSKPYEAAISAYLSSIGGVVCQREPVAYTSETQLSMMATLPGDNYVMWGEPLLHHHDIPLHEAISPTINCGNGWQTIQSAPCDGTMIWIINESGFQTSSWWDEDFNIWGELGDEDHPTHWRALPAPPSRSEEGSEKL
jgi:hypothetical protein